MIRFLKKKKLQTSFFSKKCYDHIDETFKNINVTNSYINYIYINKVIPEEDYKSLLQYLNLVDEFFNRNSVLMPDDNTNDVYLKIDEIITNLHKNDKNEMIILMELGAFIFELYYLTNYILKKLMFIFDEEISKRNINYFANYKLIDNQSYKYFCHYLKRKRLDFALDPHLHTSHEVIDVLFYLPENKKYSFNGTSLFKPKNHINVKKSDLKNYLSFKRSDFDDYNKIEYLPNSIVAWVNTHKSFHGVDYENSKLNNEKKKILILWIGI